MRGGCLHGEFNHRSHIVVLFEGNLKQTTKRRLCHTRRSLERQEPDIAVDSIKIVSLNIILKRVPKNMPEVEVVTHNIVINYLKRAWL